MIFKCATVNECVDCVSKFITTSFEELESTFTDSKFESGFEIGKENKPFEYKITISYNDCTIFITQTNNLEIEFTAWIDFYIDPKKYQENIDCVNQVARVFCDELTNSPSAYEDVMLADLVDRDHLKFSMKYTEHGSVVNNASYS